MQLPLLWKTDLTSQEWDNMLTGAAGHPLQTAAWGEAKKMSCNMVDNYWIAYQESKPVFLVRFEERRYAGFIKIAWVPKGPTVIDETIEAQAFKDFLRKLKKRNFLFCITFPWKSIETNQTQSLPQTIWINLSLGKDVIWKQTNKRFRYGVKQALQFGVTIEQTQAKEDILTFFSLCNQLSKQKKFTLNTSLSLLQNLLMSSHCEQFECRLFIARFKQYLCGGAFIIRCGENVHYFWGAVDRKLSNTKMQVGEALQWAIIQWAIEKNCTLYDLEGIDITNNPSVYQFKKKLKGRIITLPGLQIFPLSYLAKLALNCFNTLKSISFHFMW